jgi:hypothetical protein
VMLQLRDYAELESLLATLKRDGVALSELVVHPPDLEEVFLRVMGSAPEHAGGTERA